MTTLCVSFRELGEIYFGILFPCEELWEARRIGYLLEINRGGRVLVENPNNGVDGRDSPGICGSNIPSTLPLSVWPTVLARAWKGYRRDDLCDSNCYRHGGPDGVYYFLQNVPSLREGDKKPVYEKIP